MDVRVNAEEEQRSSVEELYADAVHWHVNTGGATIHAKRVPGRFRRIKWYSMALWAVFFAGPYLRWNGHQALLFDIPGRKFHLFGVTVWPQDIWMLSLVLILLAMTLFVVTAVASRVWCGYLCFQTVWTDIFTWVEDRIEGNPIQRRKLDAAPWSGRKVWLKVKKHALWMVIALLTGVTFAAYFSDAFSLWAQYLMLDAPTVAWVVLLMFFLGTYILAGFMREQVCFWLCPYARIQGVMVDKDTIMPTYDYSRGEPRGRLSSKKDGARHGDCIDCKLCVGVCPMGVDIRNGMQEGCITCGMCIDACDSIMEKIGKPKGLIRYLSRKEMEGGALPRLYLRPRVITYSAFLTLSLAGIVYGLTHISPVELAVVHGRQPLYIKMSDGSIENKYTIKALNKTTDDIEAEIFVDGVAGIRMVKPDNHRVTLKAGKLIPFSVFLRAAPSAIGSPEMPIRFMLREAGGNGIEIAYQSNFLSPEH